jgi:hypothetical protein
VTSISSCVFLLSSDRSATSCIDAHRSWHCQQLMHGVRRQASWDRPRRWGWWRRTRSSLDTSAIYGYYLQSSKRPGLVLCSIYI